MASIAPPEATAPATRVDEKLFSRQLYVLGEQAIAKMLRSSVFLSGLGGVGIEIAKNIALAGVKLLTLNDTKPASLLDLSSQFYLTPADVGQNRAVVSAPRVAELNPHHVKVQTSAIDLSADANLSTLDGYKVVIVTDATRATLLKVNDYCRARNIAFLAADVKGLCAYTFADFGAHFEVLDADGEEPKTATVATVTQSASEPVLTVLENQRHDLEDGDWIELGELKGPWAALNRQQFRVRVLSPQSVALSGANTAALPPYQLGSGGSLTQVKRPQPVSFAALREQLSTGTPSIVLADFVKLETGARQLLAAFEALWSFQERNSNALPRPWHAADADQMLALLPKLADATLCHAAVTRALAYTAAGAVGGLCAFVGGVVAQEALKALTGKYTPLRQWLLLDALELLPVSSPSVAVASDAHLAELLPRAAAELLPRQDRYDAQRICLGQALCERLAQLRLFMIGAGAIGCEMLKNFALLGVSVGADGRLTVTDNDLIEMSNLNRQFLFRERHIHTPKSTTAANATLQLNAAMHIDAAQDKVGVETETKYSDEFFAELDVVVNALDNVAARMYVDSRCVANQRPLLESGTLGTKGHVQVILPFLTETYASRRDPPERDVPYCTLKSFPSAFEHCVQWARDFAFETQFAARATAVNSLFDGAAEQLPARLDAVELSKLREMRLVLKTLQRRPASFDDCLVWARNKFQSYYGNAVRQLLHSFPLDHKLKDGTPFWAAPKRAPSPVDYAATDPLHAAFVVSAAALCARLWRVPVPQSRDELMCDPVAVLVRCDALRRVAAPVWRPKTNKQIVTDESKKRDEAQKEEAEQSVPQSAEQELAELRGRILQWVRACRPALSQLPQLEVADFEKDDDANFHIDFIAACANLRARVYSIPEQDRLRAKRIAGKIIPAIATTTAAVSGLVALELLKTVQLPARPLAHFKNAFLNLGINLYAFSEPQQVEKTRISADLTTSLWDRWEVDEGDISLAEFLAYFERNYKLKATAVLLGAIMVYMPLFGHTKRLPEKLSKLLADTGQLPKTAKHADLIVSFVSQAGEDVQAPTVRFVLPSAKKLPTKKVKS